MRKIGSYELKTHLAEILDAVEDGQTVIVTRRGRAVARISPSDEEKQERVSQAVAGLQNFPRTRLPRGVTVRHLITEGRK